MPFQLDGYRVFIASPGGLENERRGFRDTISEYNIDEAMPRNTIFEAVGWEETLGGIGRPQSLINEELRECDFFVMVLHDRWGSHPGDNETEATSGTEEEFNVAMQCLKDDSFSMKQIVVLFKAVPENQMSDPGLELNKVLDFRKKLEQDRTLLYSTFSSIGEFNRRIRRHLGAWLRNPIENQEVVPVEPMLILDEDSGVENESQQVQSKDLTKAWVLANEGRLVEAEVEFSKLVVNEPDHSHFISYAKFLIRIGRLDQALVMIEKSLSLSLKTSDNESLGMGLKEKGNVLEIRGDLDGAEAMYRQALEINEKLGRLEGMASDYGYLGIVLQTRGDLDGAEAMYKQALEINEKLGHLEGMASTYGNLGIVLKTRGDLDGAEAMYKQSLEIEEKLGRSEGMATDYGNLGNVLQTRGDLDGAEAMYKRALEINEKLGRLEGMANQYGNLGNVLQTRGDLDGAEAMYKESFRIAKEKGFKSILHQIQKLLKALEEDRNAREGSS